MRTFASSVAVAAIVIALATPAALGASANQTWVSHNGSPNNTAASPPCSMQAPCDTFDNALRFTNAGGEINCLDNGDYGKIVTAQSVTIDCGGQEGTITVSSAINGVVINGSNIVVTLRNLTINGNGSSGAGVLIQNAAAVIIENCVVKGFTGPVGGGIVVQTSTNFRLNVTDTLITNNTDGTNYAGIVFIPNFGTTTFALDRVRMENNPRGGFAVDALPGSGPVTGVIRDSVITGNGQWGVLVNSAGSDVTVSLDHTHIAGNGIGITATNGVAVILNNSTIQTNNTGLSVGSGAAIFSYGNNAINGNQPGGSAAPIQIGLR